jgi:hypothetical protein
MSNKSQKVLLTYLAITTAVVIIQFYFYGTPQIQDESVRGFLQDFLSSIFTALASFLAIYFFIESRGIRFSSSDEPSYNSPDLLPTNKIQSFLDGFKLDLKNEIDQLITLKLPEVGREIDIAIDYTKLELFKMMGLGNPQKRTVFQDFNIYREEKAIGNINAVSYFWADTLFGDAINAKIIQESDQSFLRIKFESHLGSLGCNLAVRPQNQRPADLTDTGLAFLTIWARVPEESSQDSDNLSSVGIAILIVNDKLQQWQYAYNENRFLQRRVDKGNWQRIDIPLSVDDGHWSLFKSDGNQRMDGDLGHPDFSVIAAVVIKVGMFTGKRSELEAGKGIIDIDKIEFSASQAVPM